MQETGSNTPSVVAVRGEIDIDTAPPLYIALSAALRAHPEVVLDLSLVTFTDCSGLRVLDHALRLAGEHKGRLLLRGAAPRIFEQLKLTGMHRRLTVEP